jgi:hypothetical protein
MAKKTEQRPEPGTVDREIDKGIAPLVSVLNDRDVQTVGSCSGHGEEPAYVDLGVRLSAVHRWLKVLNGVQRSFKWGSRIDVHVNWAETVATADDGTLYPGWLMLSLEVTSPRRPGPSAATLARLAKVYQNKWRRSGKRKAQP